MTTPFSPAELAAMVADRFLAGCSNPQGPSARLDLQHQLETALRTAVRTERQACAGLCEERARLWSSAGDRTDAPAPLRAEARMRYSEASWLADAIRSR